MAKQPLVIAYHLVWTAYGWWLSNDPRGSGSRLVASDIVAELGELHYGRKRVQPPTSIVRDFYEKAADVLRFPLLTFDDAAREEIGRAFADVVAKEGYTCYACAVMPDHIHILIRKHKHQAEEMAAAFKEASRACLVALGHRLANHPVWTGGNGWSVFLDHPKEIRRTIRYVEQNPIKIGLPAQRWPFVKEYDNWPFHSGHSPNSPYAKRLRELGQYPPT